MGGPLPTPADVAIVTVDSWHSTQTFGIPLVPTTPVNAVFQLPSPDRLAIGTVPSLDVNSRPPVLSLLTTLPPWIDRFVFLKPSHTLLGSVALRRSTRLSIPCLHPPTLVRRCCERQPASTLSFTSAPPFAAPSNLSDLGAS
jgi:hypothetical protein